MMDTEKPHTKPTPAVTSLFPRLPAPKANSHMHIHALTPTHRYKDRGTLEEISTHKHTDPQEHTDLCVQMHEAHSVAMPCSPNNGFLSLASDQKEIIYREGREEATSSTAANSQDALALPSGTILSQGHSTTLDT